MLVVFGTHIESFGETATHDCPQYGEGTDDRDDRQ